MTLNKKAEFLLAIAALFVASAIALGAFGAHGLRSVLSEEMLKVYNTSVQYQFYNSFGLFATTFIYMLKPSSKKILTSCYLIIVGTLIFSLSLYFLTILNIPALGAITPIGGTLQIVAYLLLFFGILKD